MIVGSGTIASAFKNSKFDWEDFLILASGVPNSSETSQDAFDREFRLIKSFSKTCKMVVYFSTVSINDTTKTHTDYVIFKKEMEKYVLQSFSKSMVLRLPIVLGPNNNPHQLLGHIKNQIAQKEKLVIYKNATRYFFDVTYIPIASFHIANWMKKERITNKAMNVGFQQQVRMENVAKFLGKKYKDLSLELLNKGDSYYVDFSLFESIVKNDLSSNLNGIDLLDKYL